MSCFIGRVDLRDLQDLQIKIFITLIVTSDILSLSPSPYSKISPLPFKVQLPSLRSKTSQHRRFLKIEIRHTKKV